MTVLRRALPASPTRRGWCPGLTRPMPTGDGLLARIHPPLGILSTYQARAIAEGSRRFGNGHIDITARANLQVRGVSEITRAPLARLLEAAGLGDVRDDGGPQRLTLTSPLAGSDPAEVIDVPGLARAIEAAGRMVAGLPAKTLVAIEGRRGRDMPDADFLVFAHAPGRVGLAVAAENGSHDLGTCDAADAPAALGALLEAFAASGRRRARDLSDSERAGLADVFVTHAVSPPPSSAGEGGPRTGSGEGQRDVSDYCARGDLSGTVAPLSPPAAQGTLPRRGGRERGGLDSAFPSAGISTLSADLAILALDASFGRCTADALDDIADAADRLGAGEIRLSPARGFVLMVRDRGRAAEALAELSETFITAPDDPRRSIAACTGAPACASGSTPTLADAARIAQSLRPRASGDLAIHVSGCAKGCARPGAADLTLVARAGLYGVVLAGGPGDPPGLHVPIEAVLERLGRADTTGLAAAFAPDRGATGPGKGGRPG